MTKGIQVRAKNTQKLEPGGQLLLRQLQRLSPLPDPLAGDIAQTIMLV